MKKKDIDEEVAQTLASIVSLNRQKAPDGFADRLNQRISFLASKSDKWLKRLQLGVAAMVVMSGLNGYFFLDFTNTSADNEIASIEDFQNAYFDSITLIDYDNE